MHLNNVFFLSPASKLLSVQFVFQNGGCGLRPPPFWKMFFCLFCFADFKVDAAEYKQNKTKQNKNKTNKKTTNKKHCLGPSLIYIYVYLENIKHTNNMLFQGQLERFFKDKQQTICRPFEACRSHSWYLWYLWYFLPEVGSPWIGWFWCVLVRFDN